MTPIVRVIAHTTFLGVPPDLLPTDKVTQSQAKLFVEADTFCKDNGHRRPERTDFFRPEVVEAEARRLVTNAGQDQGTDAERLIETAGRACFDGQTQVLTEDGWTRLDALPKGAPVATLNTATQELEYLVPDAYIEKRYQGRMYALFGRRVSLLVTPDHNLYLRGLRDDAPRLVRADSAPSTYDVLKQGSYAGRAIVPIEIPALEYVQGKSNQYGSYGSMPRTTPGMVIDVHQMADYAEFLGWYLAEGCLSGGGTSGRAIVIYQRDDRVQPITDLVDRLGWPWSKSIDDRNNVAQLRVYAAPLARHLMMCGDGSFEKRVPPYAFHWPIEARQRLIDALFAGDGTTYANGRRCYTSRSKQLAEDVQRLLVTTGKSASFGVKMDTGKPMYVVYEALRTWAQIRPHMQDWIDYDDTVYCVSSPNRTLLVRREGKVMICGNCYDSFGAGRPSSEYHQHILDVNHGSVEEHASLTFYLANISRGCTHELVRHRVGIAISQRSTRYVDESESPWAWHPLIDAYANDIDDTTASGSAEVDFIGDLTADLREKAAKSYDELVERLQSWLVGKGADKFTARKQARGAARGLLGNALCTEMVWSCNVRSLRTILDQRAKAGADAEIRVLFNRIYEEALPYFPAYLQYEKRSCPDGIGYELFDPKSPAEKLKRAEAELENLRAAQSAVDSPRLPT